MDENIELRKEILKYALHLEDTVTSIIKSYFYVYKEKPKALSHKSGSLSFKNKIDLLYDFDILSEDENFALLRLMEFRNQFMHNLNCVSFISAVEILGTDRGNYLLKYLENEQAGYDSETKYLMGFRNCFLDIQGKLIDKFELQRKKIEFKSEILKGLSYNSMKLVDIHFDCLRTIIDELKSCVIAKTVDPKIASNIINKAMSSINSIKNLNRDDIEITPEIAIRMIK